MNKSKTNKNLKIKNSLTYRRLREIMDSRVRLAVEVNEARKNKGLTQQSLARIAGTTQKVISKIESGDTNIGFDLLQRIAKATNLRMQIGKFTLAGEGESRAVFQLPSQNTLKRWQTSKNR